MTKLPRRQFLAALGATLGAGAIPLTAHSGKKVKLGVCANAATFPKVVHYGFDYIEPAAADIAAMSESGFGDFKQQVIASPIRCECFNNFIRSLRVDGDNVNSDALRNYMEIALTRCRELGGTIVVWGSSGSRNVPPGFSRIKRGNRSWISCDWRTMLRVQKAS